MVFQHKLGTTEEVGLHFFPLFLHFRRDSTHESGGTKQWHIQSNLYGF